MATLPTVGGSTNTWGTELNTWLQVEHTAAGLHSQLTGPIGIGIAPTEQLHSYSTTSVQALFNGWNVIDAAANAAGGTIQIGNNVAYHGAISYTHTGTELYIDNVWDNAGSAIKFRTRTAGTPLTPLTLIGGEVGIGGDPEELLTIREATTGANSTFLHFRQSAGDHGFKFGIDSASTGNFFITSRDTGSDIAKIFNLTKSGNVLIGNTTGDAKVEIWDDGSGAPTTALRVYSNQNSASTDGLVHMHADNAVAPFTVLNVIQDGTGLAANFTGGNVQLSVLTGGAINVTTDASGNIIRDPSDIKFKHNIREIYGALDTVCLLRGREFTWNEDTNMGSGEDIGLIAQEVSGVDSRLVVSAEYMSIKQNALIALLIEAVKELRQQVDIMI